MDWLETPMSQPKIEFEWILPESEKDALIRAIEMQGGEVDDRGLHIPMPGEQADHPEAGLDPMTVIAIASAAVYVVQSLVKTWRDRNIRGSTYVDARGGKLRIRRVPSGPNGQVVIFNEGGQAHVFERSQENEGRAMLQDVLRKFTPESNK
jgi:hypothetical protein